MLHYAGSPLETNPSHTLNLLASTPSRFKKLANKITQRSSQLSHRDGQNGVVEEQVVAADPLLSARLLHRHQVRGLNANTKQHCTTQSARFASWEKKAAKSQTPAPGGGRRRTGWIPALQACLVSGTTVGLAKRRRDQAGAERAPSPLHVRTQQLFVRFERGRIDFSLSHRASRTGPISILNAGH